MQWMFMNSAFVSFKFALIINSILIDVNTECGRKLWVVSLLIIKISLQHVLALYLANVVLFFTLKNFVCILLLVKNISAFWQYFLINPFSTNVPLPYPLKTSENLRFSEVFREYRSETLVENGFSYSSFVCKACNVTWLFLLIR